MCKGEKEITVILGNEYDQKLRTRLIQILKKLNAQPINKTWGVGGSQELEELLVNISGKKIMIEAETYVGLSVTGNSHIVNNIKLLINRALSEEGS